MVFGQNLKILALAKSDTMERASQEEQNGANFSFVALSSEEFMIKKLIKEFNFSAKTERNDFGKQGYHRKP